MKFHTAKIGPQGRSGLTWVEIVVAICIFVLVLAVVSPALPKRHKAAHKLECLNNMRNIALAMQNYASGTNGNLPPIAGLVSAYDGSVEKGTISTGWPIAILPALDSTALLKNIKKNALHQAGETGVGTLRIAETERVWMPVFTCPQDQTAYRKPGGLSFVVNGGFMSRSLYHGDPDGHHRLGLLSWNGNNVSDEEEDIRIGAATGVFWRDWTMFQSSFDYISDADGTSSTLMVTENLQAGNWFDTDTARITFGLPIAAKEVEVPFGSGTFFESIKRPLNSEFTGGTLATATPKDWRINCEPKAAEGTLPRPSSNHEGGVNVIFCDGHGNFLSDTIDPHVYVKLLTSNGVEFGEGELNKSAY